MRHHRDTKRFSRNSSHLRAMMRNMASSLFRHERIVTTPQKAKECRKFAERLITLAKKGGLANFRRTLALLDDKEMAQKLFKELGPRYASRQGGYTRILHLADLRVGDRARQCIFELVEEEAASKKKSHGKKGAAHPHPKKPKAEGEAAKAEKSGESDK